MPSFMKVSKFAQFHLKTELFPLTIREMLSNIYDKSEEIKQLKTAGNNLKTESNQQVLCFLPATCYELSQNNLRLFQV